MMIVLCPLKRDGGGQGLERTEKESRRRVLLAVVGLRLMTPFYVCKQWWSVWVSCG